MPWLKPEAARDGRGRVVRKTAGVHEGGEAGHGRDKTASWLRLALAQLRIKLTLPYVFLALSIAFVTAYLVTRLLISLLDDRFQTALIDAGHQATDTVVRVEAEQLATWRAIAYTKGFAEALMARDGDGAAVLVAPLVVNARLDCFDVLDAEGRVLTAMHHEPGGEVIDYDTSLPDAEYREWPIVRSILAGEVDQFGDKYAGLVKTEWGWVFYTAGPVTHDGELVGVLLVGTYLDDLARRLDNAALARISVYIDGGVPIATTLGAEEPGALALGDAEYKAALGGQEIGVLRRQVEVAGRAYAQIVGPFRARYEEDMGVLGVALPLSFISDARQPTRQMLLILFSAVTAVVLIVGALVASVVVRRIQRLAAATRRVAAGDLTVSVEVRGNDELAALGRDFNYMVQQLQEGRAYRDLLCLTASRQVAERLHRAFEQGRLTQEAQLVVATVLFVDIRGFTGFAESRDPAEVMDFLNEYLHGFVSIVQHHGGVVSKFLGDAAMAFFGVLPEARPPAEAARNALAAALAIVDHVETFNRRREPMGDRPLRVGVGVSTGRMVAGTLGSEQRLEYTILGDAVNVAERLSGLNKVYPRFDLFISGETYRLLQRDLEAGVTPLGSVAVRGRVKPLDVYAIGTW